MELELNTITSGALVNDFGGGMLETYRFHVKWSHNSTSRNIGGTFNLDPKFYNVFTMCPVIKMCLAFCRHETKA